jgi:hypothetical protein
MHVGTHLEVDRNKIQVVIELDQVISTISLSVLYNCPGE